MNQSAYVAANTDFALDLLRETHAASPDGRVQVSPWSVRRALLMAALGSPTGSATRRAFRNVFQLASGVKLQSVCGDAQRITKQLLKVEAGGDAPTTLTVANGLWLKKGTPFKDAFKTANEKYFDASVEDIQWDDTGMKRVNDWVFDKTKKITSIVDDMPKDGRAFLTDALYINTPASERFMRYNDKTAKFGIGADAFDVTYMVHPYVELNYLQADGAQVLQFPFGRFGVFNYYLVLPNRGNDVASLLKTFRGRSWLNWKQNLQKGEGRFALAPNAQEFSTDLITPLSKMGLEVAFTDDAEFGDMSAEPLKIGAVKHKTVTKFTRRGFEGAAVTSVGMVAITSAPIRQPKVPFDITVDRGYMWFVEGAGEMLFAATTPSPKVPDTFAAEDLQDAAFQPTGPKLGRRHSRNQ